MACCGVSIPRETTLTEHSPLDCHRWPLVPPVSSSVLSGNCSSRLDSRYLLVLIHGFHKKPTILITLKERNDRSNFSRVLRAWLSASNSKFLPFLPKRKDRCEARAILRGTCVLEKRAHCPLSLYVSSRSRTCLSSRFRLFPFRIFLARVTPDESTFARQSCTESLPRDESGEMRSDQCFILRVLLARSASVFASTLAVKRSTARRIS